MVPPETGDQGGGRDALAELLDYIAASLEAAGVDSPEFGILSIKALEQSSLMVVRVPNPELFGELTKRQREIALLVARGMKNIEIADSLELSLTTINAHLRNSFKKLGISTRLELAQYVGFLGRIAS